MSIVFSFGSYGFSISLKGMSKRICIGFCCITAIPVRIDDILKNQVIGEEIIRRLVSQVKNGKIRTD